MCSGSDRVLVMPLMARVFGDARSVQPLQPSSSVHQVLTGTQCTQFEYLTRKKIADGPLIAKWRKPGYEILCSMLAIQKGNHNFGTTSHCRVPLKQRAAQQRITPDVQIGCISCASGA